MKFLLSFLTLTSLLPTSYAALSQCITSIQTEAIFRDQFTSGEHWNRDFEQPKGYASGLHRGWVSPLLREDDYTPMRRDVPGDRPVTITSDQTFYSWYHDVDVNSPAHLAGSPPNCKKVTQLKLNRVGTSDLFTYKNNNFFPLDGQCWDDIDYLRKTTGIADYPAQTMKGADGKGHNFGFTTQLQGTFKFGGKEKFVFCGDDDVWVYIDSKLALDIGGVHSKICRAVDFAEMTADGYITPYDCEAFPCPANKLLPAERLKVGPLIIGSVYYMDMFHAERHTTESNFVLTTSLELGYSDANGIPGFRLAPDTESGIDLALNPVILNVPVAYNGQQVIGNSTTIYAIAQIIPDSALTLSCISKNGLVNPFSFTYARCGTQKITQATVSLTNNYAAINAAIARGQGSETIVCTTNSQEGVFVGVNTTMKVKFYRFAPQPIIIADATTITLPNNMVSLDGSTTIDIDTATNYLTYTWSLVSGPSAMITSPTESLTSVQLSTPGIYVFKLTVTDDTANVASKTVTITVKAAPTTATPTTPAPIATTPAPTTTAPTTTPTTKAPIVTTAPPTTTKAPIVTTAPPTQAATKAPTTTAPPTQAATAVPTTTKAPTAAATATPTTQTPTTSAPTASVTAAPTTPSTQAPTTTKAPTAAATVVPTSSTTPTPPPTPTPTPTPTIAATTVSPTTKSPATSSPTRRQTTPAPTDLPPLDSGNVTTEATTGPTTSGNTSVPTPTTSNTDAPTTLNSNTAAPTTATTTTPTTAATTSPTATGATSSTGTVDSSSSSSGVGPGADDVSNNGNGNSVGAQRTGSSVSSSSFPIIPVAAAAGGVGLIALIAAVIMVRRRKLAATRDRIFSDVAVAVPHRNTLGGNEEGQFTESPLQAFMNQSQGPPTLRWSQPIMTADQQV